MADAYVVPRCLGCQRAKADAWDEGRQALLDELGGFYRFYNTSSPTPNPYRAALDGDQPKPDGPDWRTADGDLRNADGTGIYEPKPGERR